ncbi:hypothetical protein PHYPSEUDO_010813 [Phytophthora pseudosyringae]|uniref:Uncharacterized protein n=1 Tax=Phytophthora pseudosyringae TaxID=221518 RepID=A0A8T1W7C2_9STRA|nr:hypothetical protein PHYPSEUDO_010813 [Phytophthora pseudosyringae]
MTDVKASSTTVKVMAAVGINDASGSGRSINETGARECAFAFRVAARLSLNGAISFSSGFVSVDKVEFILTKGVDALFDEFSVEMAPLSIRAATAMFQSHKTHPYKLTNLPP